MKIKWKHAGLDYGIGYYGDILVEYSLGIFKSSGYRYRISGERVSDKIYYDSKSMIKDIINELDVK